MKRNGGARHAALSSSDEAHTFTCIHLYRGPSRLTTLRCASVYYYRYQIIG